MDLAFYAACARDFRTGLGHFNENFFFLGGISFYCLHIVGNKVVTTLQLVLHLGPGRLDTLIHCYEVVIGAFQVDKGNNNDNENDDGYNQQ